MKQVAKYLGAFLVVATAVGAGWVLAQDSSSDSETEDSCEWKFQGNHTSTDAKGHFWNECTGELYYIVGTSAERANVNLD